MSNGTEDSMWKSNTASSSSRFSTLKGLVPTTQRDAMRTFFDRRVPSTQDARSLAPPGHMQERKISWREWAGDKIRRRGSSMSDAVEKVSLFPGWAARRYHDPKMEGKEAAEFSLEIFVSGFAASYVPPESATRSQRAFMRLAKAYAALPKLPSLSSEQQTPSNGMMTRQLSSSTEDLLKSVNLPPTPNDITEESELAALEKQFRNAELEIETESLNSTESGSTASSSNNTPPILTPGTSPRVSYATATAQFTSSPTDLTRLHANLNSRLQPFWSRALPNRALRLSLYSNWPRSDSYFPDEEMSCDDPTRQPIYVHVMNTGAQGAFEARLRVPWERICVHPGALHVAFGDTNEDAELFICAELLPPSSPTPALTTQESTARSVLPVSVSQSEIRLISDVDDTIKLSNILGGARAVFQNVFVKHLEELVISGMGDWYTRMWSRGVRFHYVSNSPFELLPVINEFIKVSNLPQGSIKLRSYAGRSLFNGLLSTPAARKRAGILDILNAFSSSRFFLVGDSGEQDLELYAQVASQRHNQILAVFIRDARGPDAQPIDDPSGEEIKRQPTAFRRTTSHTAGIPLPSPAAETNLPVLSPLGETLTQKTVPRAVGNYGVRSSPRPYINTSAQDYISAVSPPPSSSPSTSRSLRPGVAPRSPSDPTPSMGLPSTFFDSGLILDTSSSSSSSPPSPAPSVGGLQFPGSLTEAETANLSPTEKRRYKLQERVYRARLLMPSHIPLRVFMDPEECVDADRILNDLAGTRQSDWNRR